MPGHVLVYYGYYDTSFHRLVPGQTKTWRKDAVESPLDQPPEKFTGIRFGYMDRRDGFVFTQIDDLVLHLPVLFVGGRHGVKGPGPQWTSIDDEGAAHILADAIVSNPDLRDLLAERIRKIGRGDQG